MAKDDNLNVNKVLISKLNEEDIKYLFYEEIDLKLLITPIKKHSGDYGKNPKKLGTKFDVNSQIIQKQLRPIAYEHYQNNDKEYESILSLYLESLVLSLKDMTGQMDKDNETIKNTLENLSVEDLEKKMIDILEEKGSSFCPEVYFIQLKLFDCAISEEKKNEIRIAWKLKETETKIRKELEKEYDAKIKELNKAVEKSNKDLEKLNTQMKSNEEKIKAEYDKKHIDIEDKHKKEIETLKDTFGKEKAELEKKYNERIDKIKKEKALLSESVSKKEEREELTEFTKPNDLVEIENYLLELIANANKVIELNKKSVEIVDIKEETKKQINVNASDINELLKNDLILSQNSERILRKELEEKIKEIEELKNK